MPAVPPVPGRAPGHRLHTGVAVLACALALAAAASSKGHQIAFAAGTSLQFQLAQPVTLERAVAVAAK